MRFHSQNLNEDRSGKVVGSMFWRGRAWLYTKPEIHWEWMIGKYARDFAITLGFGEGDDDSGILFHICIPWVFSFYFGVAGVKRLKQPHKTGVAIHNGGFWVYPFTNEHDHKHYDPWWERFYCWYFPWTYDWYSTEILTQHTPELAESVYIEKRGGPRNEKDPFTNTPVRYFAEEANSETHDYTYTLKSGEVQHRKATIYVDRMVWRMRWWPILPFNKTRTCISIRFNEEVGEGTGSWKGGCTGCGYEMNPFETPWECLRRMERERKFSR